MTVWSRRQIEIVVDERSVRPTSGLEEISLNLPAARVQVSDQKIRKRVAGALSIKRKRSGQLVGLYIVDASAPDLTAYLQRMMADHFGKRVGKLHLPRRLGEHRAAAADARGAADIDRRCAAFSDRIRQIAFRKTRYSKIARARNAVAVRRPKSVVMAQTKTEVVHQGWAKGMRPPDRHSAIVDSRKTGAWLYSSERG